MRINTAFAFTYNVGDTHVFYLPSHLFTALLAGVALRGAGRSAGPLAYCAALRARPTLLRVTAIVAIVLALRRLARLGYLACDRSS